MNRFPPGREGVESPQCANGAPPVPGGNAASGGFRDAATEGATSVTNASVHHSRGVWGPTDPSSALLGGNAPPLHSSLRRSPQALQAQRFVDALRECLGLAPLYSDPPRLEAERFHPRQGTVDICGHTDGCRRVREERRVPQ